jgi:hypothetical protein
MKENLETLLTQIYTLTNPKYHLSSEDMQTALEDIRDLIEESNIFEIPETLK